MRKGLNRCMDVCSECGRTREVEECMHGCIIYMKGMMGRLQVKPLIDIERYEKQQESK